MGSLGFMFYIHPFGDYNYAGCSTFHFGWMKPLENETRLIV